MYHLLAILTACVWGTTFVSTKVLLLAGLTPTSIFLFRFLLAYAGMAMACRGRLFCGNRRDEMLMFVAGLTGGSLYFLAENTALELAPAGNVSLVVCLAPLVTILLDGVVRRARSGFSLRLCLGSVLAFAGVAFIVSGEGSDVGAHPLLGGLLAFLAATLWAVYQLIVKPLCSRYGALLLTRKVFGYGLCSLLLLRMFGLPLLPPRMQILYEPVVWGNLLYLGLVASLACYFVWNKVVEKLGPVVSANYIYLNPLTTCFFSYLVLDEHISAAMLLGAVGVLAGVYMAVTVPPDGRSARRSART